MHKYSTKLFVRGKLAATLRNGGALCDIRRHRNGFLYSPTPRVAVSAELLDQLDDTVILQFTNLDTGDVWTTTVADFRRLGEVIQFGSFEPQVAVELARLNHTRKGGAGRKNEPLHVEEAPVKSWQQMTMGG